MTVSLVTFCHPPHYAEKLHRPGVLRHVVESHQQAFADVLVVHQRCKAEDYAPFDYPCRTIDLPAEAFDPLFQRFGVNPSNPRADELSHGPGGAHFWRWHLGNQLCGLENTTTDYVVFADCDTAIVRQPSSWIDYGISILENYPNVLIVGPGDGAENGGPGEGGRILGDVRLTRNVSQQLFICRSQQFRQEVNFDVEWDGKFDAPGGPMQEFAVMMEGRLWLYMRATGTWRAVLPDRFRYWHWSQWDPPGCYGKVEW